MITRGSIVWFDFGHAVGSAPSKRRPVLVVQEDAYNASALATILVAAMTSNTAAAERPGNVFVPASASGLTKDSVVNVTQLATVDREFIDEVAGRLPAYLMGDVDRGLRTALGL